MLKALTVVTRARYDMRFIAAGINLKFSRLPLTVQGFRSLFSYNKNFVSILSVKILIKLKYIS